MTALDRSLKFSMLLAFVLAAGCTDDEAPGGGGSGGGSATLPELSALTGDADNHDLLFFTSTVEGSSGLYAVDPADPDASPILLDDAIDLSPTAASAGYDFSFFAMHEATLTDDGFADFRVAQVLYTDNVIPLPDVESQGLYRAFTDATPPLPAPESVSDVEYAFFSTVFIQQSLGDADDATLLYLASDSWLQIRMGDDGATPPLALSESYEPVAPIFDPVAGAGAGYLVIDEDDGDTLKMIGMDLEPVAGDPAVLHDGSPITGLASAQRLGTGFGDGSMFMVLGTADAEEGEGDLWYYSYEAGGPGTMTRVLGAGDEPLVFPQGLFSLGKPGLPSPQHLGTSGDRVVFARAGDLFGFGDFDVVVASPEGWSVIATESGLGEFLIVEGERLAIHAGDAILGMDLTGGDRVYIDPDDEMYGQSISAGVLGSRDGFIYYNREATEVLGQPNREYAMAAKIDGSAILGVPDARVIGATTTGASRETGVQLDALELGEIFLLREGREVAALSALDPAAGAVRLGTLPDDASSARMFGLGPGPHRLLQASTDDSPASHHVLYVNTREEDSLRVVSFAASDNPNQRPLTLF
jgi:hypothetical protein